MGSKQFGTAIVPPVIDSEAAPFLSSAWPAASPTAWPIMRERMALNWRLPPDELDAALLLGLPDVPPPPDLSSTARDKAAAAAEWAAVYLHSDPADHQMLQRRLFRAVYCDWPDLRHVLRLLAAHHARLFFGPADDLALAEQTRLAYVPVVRMLGIWRLHRGWLEEAVRRAMPDEYAKAAGQFGVAPWTDCRAGFGDGPVSGADMLEDHLTAVRQAWAGDAGGKLSKVERFKFDNRMIMFSQLRHQLDAALSAEFTIGPRPRLELLPLMPGVTVNYAHARRQTLDQWLRQLPQLHLRLFCASEADCYRALRILHRVAPPIRPGDDTRLRDFTDHIARPQPNGYRALQTTCQWPPGDDGRLVRCHILTEAMQDLNEWGVMSRPTGDDGPKPGLWHSLERVSHSLTRRGGDDIAAYLQHHDLNDASNPIYCFTPQGEIVLLEQGSLPLDFAYRVHTELGHRAALINVNGRPADLTTPLQNGDLVRITFDASAVPLDFAWQGKARSKSSRRKIRTELRRRAAAIHPGRGRFKDELIHKLDVYQHDINHRREDADTIVSLIPTTADIDHFLRRSALRLGLATPESLYERLAVDERLVGELAHRLFSEKIIRALRPVGGRGAAARLADVVLCDHCRPTRNPIRVLRRSGGHEGDVVVIHRPICNYASPIAPEIGLEWAEQDTPDDWPLYRYDIGAPDDDGLLIRLLEIVRAMPHAYLFRADASVSERNRAYIMLDVALRLPQSRGDLKHLLEQTGAEANYDYLPAERRRSDVRAADFSREMNNPFTRSHVTDWRFFDRDEVTTRLTRWLYRHAAETPLMLLYGQRRVGKSSLVNRFFEKERLVEYPDRPVVPVYVDFRLPDLSRPETVAELLGRHINARLNLHDDRPRPGEDPMVWLDGLLLAAQSRLRDARLLIIIDEFDADINRRLMSGDRHLRSLAALQAIMSTHSFIRWLLVVQDVYLADPHIQAALPELPYSFTQLEVRHLDRYHARNLIRTLMTQSGYRPERTGKRRPDRLADGSPLAGLSGAEPDDAADIFDRVVDWSAGNPYFIHLIGRELIDSADAGGRKHITEADFYQAVNVVLGREAEFSHFTEHLTPGSPRRAIAGFVAAACEPGQSLPLAVVIEEIVQRRRLMSLTDAHRTIDVLERLGVLATTRDPAGDRVDIPVRLLHKWIKITWES